MIWGKIRVIIPLIIILFSAGGANADTVSLREALNVARSTPGKYYHFDRMSRPAAQAEETVASVKAIVGLMNEAMDVAAMLPQKETAAVSSASARGGKREAREVKDALAIAGALPVNKGTSTSASVSRKLLWPVDGTIYSGFNSRRGSKRIHGAIDIVTKKGTPIGAAADGVVSVVANGGREFKGYGKTVILNHGGGMYTLYSHCSSTLVKMGQRVKRGDTIATVGRTGRATTDHVHFEIRVSGAKRDPLQYLPSRPAMVKVNNKKR
jgi:murein DD-endopeptidase MepM/ murein hydrolase activator NlpD